MTNKVNNCENRFGTMSGTCLLYRASAKALFICIICFSTLFLNETAAQDLFPPNPASHAGNDADVWVVNGDNSNNQSQLRLQTGFQSFNIRNIGNSLYITHSLDPLNSSYEGTGDQLFSLLKDGDLLLTSNKPLGGVHIHNRSGNPQLTFRHSEYAGNDYFGLTVRKDWLDPNNNRHGMSMWDGVSNVFNVRNGNIGVGTEDPTYSHNGETLSGDAQLSLLGGTAGSNGGKSRLNFGGDDHHYASIVGEHSGAGRTHLSFMTASGATLPDEKMRIEHNGRVGIGITSPSEKLEVAGNIKANAFIGDGSQLTGIAGANGSFSGAQSFALNVNEDLKVNTGSNDSLFSVSYSPAGTGDIPSQDLPKVKINTNADISNDVLLVGGNVHIGPRSGIRRFNMDVDGDDLNEVTFTSTNRDGTTETYSREYLLWVERGVVASDFLVLGVENWADYVFKENYKLASLEEVEEFIDKNGHLPNIPSEKEVLSTGGFSAKDLNIKLLEKIEELTLYVLQLNKELKTQQDLVLKQSIKLQELESKLR